MATKTISLELDAYEKLRATKRAGESFSAVVRRASWRVAGRVVATQVAITELREVYQRTHPSAGATPIRGSARKNIPDESPPGV